MEGGTFWLSESPSVPGSVSWGALVPCIATWVISLPFAFIAQINPQCFSPFMEECYIICFLDMMSTHSN